MWIFVGRRLFSIPPLLFVISLLTYLLMQATPGDYFKRLEENPLYSQDYVMEQRASVGKVLAIDAEDRRDALGTFTIDGREFSFDAAGALLLDGAPTSAREQQRRLGRFVWPAADGDSWTVTDTGKVFRWVGPLRGYVAWLGNVLSGELGDSFQYKSSVASVIADRMLNTLLLGSVSMLLAWGIAIPLGVWSGVRPNSWVDHACGFVAYFGLSIPSVFLALLALLFASYTGWFPVGNMRHEDWDSFSFGGKVADIAWHLALPAAVVSLTSLAGYMRQMRGQMVETMSSDYVRTARAKGVSERVVTFRHALRNAINPLVTLFGFSVAALLSGSFLVEVVLNWPGLARVVVDAVFAQDEPLVLAAIMMATLLLVAGNLLADVLLAVVDPRIRLR